MITEGVYIIFTLLYLWQFDIQPFVENERFLPEDDCSRAEDDAGF
jgi:hypothetical protein